MTKKRKGFDTESVHRGYEPRSGGRARTVPIYQSSAFQFESADHAARLFEMKEDGHIYSRISNPTVEVLEKRLASLEGGSAALATASGQAAIALAVLTITGNGDNIVSSGSLYGGTYTLFRYTLGKMGIETRFVDTSEPGNVDEAIDADTTLVYTETIGNPKNNVDDLEEIANIAHQHSIPLVTDSTVTTPYLLRPFELGADVVVHSLTKYICGHGTTIGGAIVEGGEFDWGSGKFPDIAGPDPSHHGVSFWEMFGDKGEAYIRKARAQYLRDLGPCLSPFSAFLFLQGMETLSLRMERHVSNAMQLAEWLSGHPLVSWVNYPGLPSHPDHEMAKRYLKKGYGAVIGFGVKGGLESGRRFLDSLELISHVSNIGDARTLAVHPASTTHGQLTGEEREKAGVTDDFIRLCVGIESPEDLRDDLDRSLRASQG